MYGDAQFASVVLISYFSANTLKHSRQQQSLILHMCQGLDRIGIIIGISWSFTKRYLFHY